MLNHKINVPVVILVSAPGRASKYFSHREFSFTLKDDVYIRYQSFSDQKDMEKEIQKRCPYKIDIGAVFSQKVIKRQSVNLMAKENRTFR